MDWLKQLELDLWWRALFAAGLALVVAAMAAKNVEVTIIGLGMAAVGFGEWLNRPKAGVQEFGYLKTWYVRIPTISGLLLDGIGLLLMAYGLYRLLTS